MHPFVLVALVSTLLGAASWLGYKASDLINPSKGESYYVSVWHKSLDEQDTELSELRKSLSQEVSALVMRLGAMQAELNRLDALGLAMARNIAGESELAELVQSVGEAPGLGGPESQLSLAANPSLNDLEFELLALSDKIDLRKQQLTALNDYFSTSVLKQQVYPAGFPVMKGWVSSPYGYRASPFSGRRSFHYGIDIASREEEAIRAIASGVVVYSGKQSGYGNLIEIDHGNGYTTRYAHHKQAFVSKGTTVRKGDVIALIGSEGRSTGPHLHLEVLHDNRHINPLEFIKRNN